MIFKTIVSTVYIFLFSISKSGSVWKARTVLQAWCVAQRKTTWLPNLRPRIPSSVQRVSGALLLRLTRMSTIMLFIWFLYVIKNLIMKYVNYMLFCDTTSTRNFSHGLLNWCVHHISHRPNKMLFPQLSPKCENLVNTNVLQKYWPRFFRQRCWSSAANGLSKTSGNI